MAAGVPLPPDPALWTAALIGETEEVRLLLVAGADTEEKGGRSAGSALHSASMNGHDDMILLLLEHGADVSARDIYGETPLHRAVCKGHEGVILLLLQHGAEVSSRDNFGDMPLHRAARKGLESIILLFIEHGADVFAKNVAGVTPEQHATYGSHLHAVALLKAEAVRRAERHMAFAMGQLDRLGAQSWVQGLDADVVQMVLEQV